MSFCPIFADTCQGFLHLFEKLMGDVATIWLFFLTGFTVIKALMVLLRAKIFGVVSQIPDESEKNNSLTRRERSCASGDTSRLNKRRNEFNRINLE